MCEKQRVSFWQRVVFSPLVIKASASRKIAYIAIMTALSVVCNMFFEIKLADVQYSFTFAISALIGILIGGGVGFVACFLGDLIGFLCSNAGFAYMPWIGISTGVVALISGMIFHLITNNGKATVFIKLFAISILTFLICSVGINTTAFWFLYNHYKNISYIDYCVIRFIVQGQILSSVVNYTLLFIVVPIIKRVSFFKNLNI